MGDVLHVPREAHVFTKRSLREIDRLAIEQYSIPSLILMENAAIALTQACLDLIAARGLSRVAICCGRGNNAGDGLALARHLANRGFNPLVFVIAPVDAYTGDPRAQLAMCESMGLRLIDPILAMAPQAVMEIVLEDGPIAPTPEEARKILIVDAILGTGQNRPLGQPLERLVAWINAMRQRGASVLAVDVPTGLDCDTGIPFGSGCVRADVTVSLCGMKKGYLQPDARAYTGEVWIGDIGAPLELLRRFAEPAP